MRKKLFAVLVALCMVLSLLPTAAFALEDADEADDSSYEDDADIDSSDEDGEDEDDADAEDAGDEEETPARRNVRSRVKDLTNNEDEDGSDGENKNGTEEEPGIWAEIVTYETAQPLSDGISIPATTDETDTLDADGSPVAIDAENEDDEVNEPTEEGDAGTEEEEAEEEESFMDKAVAERKDAGKTSVGVAPLYDNSADEDEDGTVTPRAYEITACEKDEEDDGRYDVYNVSLHADDVKKHMGGPESGENPVDWVGIGLIPEGAERVKYGFAYGETYNGALEKMKAKETAAPLEPAVNPKGEEGHQEGLAVYFSLKEAMNKLDNSEYLWIAVTWTDSNNKEVTQIFRVFVSRTGEVYQAPEKEAPEEVETPEETETPEEPAIPSVSEKNRDRDDNRDNDNDRDSDSSGGTSAPAAPAAPAEPAAPAAPATETAKAEVAAATTTSDGTAKAEVSGENMNKAIENAVTEAVKQGTKPVVEVEVQTTADAKSLNVELPAASLKTLAGAENASLAITSGVAAVTLDHTALSALANSATGSTVTLEVVPVAAAALNEAQKASVGETATVVDLALLCDGVAIESYGEGTITVSLPFALAEGVDAASIVVCFLAEDGTLTPCETTYMDGQVTFVTTHLGEYVIGTK